MAAQSSLGELSAELVLRVLAHIDDARDIIHLGQANRRLHAFARDGLLWRRLFIRDFLLDRPSMRYSKRRRTSQQEHAYRATTSQASSSRSIASLPRIPRSSLPPALGSIEDDLDNDKLDWLGLYKVSKNWQTGRFRAHRLATDAEDQRDVLGIATSRKGKAKAQEAYGIPARLDTLVASKAHVIFTASRHDKPGTVPALVRAFASGPEGKCDADRTSHDALAMFESPGLRGKYSASTSLPPVAAMAVDGEQHGVTTIRLAITYSDASTSVVEYSTESKSFRELVFATALERDTDVVTSALYSPYYAICTADFRIGIYYLDDVACIIQKVDERRSYSCHWPACLRLERFDKTDPQHPSARLSIAYTAPTYPHGWTVGLQEFVVYAKSVVATRSAIARRVHVNTRLDSPAKAHTSSKANPSAERAKLCNPTSRTVEPASKLTSLSYEHPYIVVGSQDNEAACFHVQGAADTTSVSPNDALSISYAKALYGHTGSIHSVSLNEGRCVTGGGDGSVRVWCLGDEELSIARATGLLATLDGRIRRGLGKVVSLRLGSETVRGQKRQRENEEDTDPIATEGSSTSLSRIMRQMRSRKETSSTTQSPIVSDSTHSIVRWVSSTFDRIISVSSTVPSSGFFPVRLSGASACRDEVRDEEQVQVWSFAA